MKNVGVHNITRELEGVHHHANSNSFNPQHNSFHHENNSFNHHHQSSSFNQGDIMQGDVYQQNIQNGIPHTEVSIHRLGYTDTSFIKNLSHNQKTPIESISNQQTQIVSNVPSQVNTLRTSNVNFNRQSNVIVVQPQPKNILR